PDRLRWDMGLDAGAPCVAFMGRGRKTMAWIDAENSPQVHPMPRLHLPPNIARRVWAILDGQLAREQRQLEDDLGSLKKPGWIDHPPTRERVDYLRERVDYIIRYRERLKGKTQ